MTKLTLKFYSCELLVLKKTWQIPVVSHVQLQVVKSIGDVSVVKISYSSVKVEWIELESQKLNLGEQVIVKGNFARGRYKLI